MTLVPFDQAVREHGPTIYRVCAAVVGPDDAEDAWAETFLAALKAYPGLRPGSNVRGWLVTIAHRKAIDAYRSRRRRPVPAGDLPDPPVSDPPLPDAASGLHTALGNLPYKQRAAVAYRYLADLSYEEIAGLLGHSEAAARRAAADGIAALRQTYHHEEQPS